MLLIGWVFEYVVDWLGVSVCLIGWVVQYVVDWLGGSVCC